MTPVFFYDCLFNKQNLSKKRNILKHKNFKNDFEYEMKFAISCKKSEISLFFAKNKNKT